MLMFEPVAQLHTSTSSGLKVLVLLQLSKRTLIFIFNSVKQSKLNLLVFIITVTVVGNHINIDVPLTLHMITLILK